MPTRKALKQLEQQFLNDLIDVIEHDCKEYFIDLMTESIQEVVYNAYTPTQYRRRKESGGLIDPRNYMLKAFFDRKGNVCVFMKNMTTGEGKAFYIDEGIVTGENFYDWERSQAYYLANHGGFERDFYTYMEVMVVNDTELQRIISKGMKKKGWKSK